MNLNLLRTYVRVVETQNFSRTAEEFGISQPAVTKQIQTLEDRYGVLLLERSGRKLKPTEAGQTLYLYARDVLRVMDKTDRAMADFTENLKGSLHLGASTIPGQYILPPLIKRFKEKNPHINISLDIGDTDMIFNRIADRELDVGVVGGWNNNRKVDGFKWLDDELVLVVPERHRLASHKTVSLQNLQHEKWIIREKGSGTRKAIEDMLDMNDFNQEDVNVYLEAGSTEAVLAMVESGMGIAIVSRWAVQRPDVNPRLSMLHLDVADTSRGFYVIYPNQKVRRKSVNQFIDYVKKLEEVKGAQ